MLEPTILLGIAIIISMNFYILMGGADYGGGVWDLLARGPSKKAQQDTITSALGPIWEANHVWLILVIVIVFSAFPSVYSQLSTTLHIPLTVLLLGIVARGTSFTFRTYDNQDDRTQRKWGSMFAISSLVTPIILGIIVGAITEGHFITEGGSFYDHYIRTWTTPFCLAIGLLTLSLVSFLAAVYLSVYSKTKELKEIFRKRALVSQIVSASLALFVFYLSESYAPDLRVALLQSFWSNALFVITFLFASCCTFFLVERRYELARFLAAGQVTFILWGWALAQYPYLIRPDFTLENSAGAPTTLNLLVTALGAGAFLLFPSFYFLVKVFHSDKSSKNPESKTAE